MQSTCIWGLPLAQRGPIELSGMLGMFHISAARYSSHQTQVAMVSEATETKELRLRLYLMLTNLNVNNHRWPSATPLNSKLWSQEQSLWAPGFSWWGDGCLPKRTYIETDEK